MKNTINIGIPSKGRLRKDVLKISKRKKLKLLRKVSDKEITRVYKGTLAISGTNNPLLTYLLSPALNTYWKIIRHLI